MSGEIIFNAEDQSNITELACELSVEIENTMPRVPWFSNSKQQDTFKTIIEMISAKVGRISADQDSKNALIFWTLALLYANKKSFQVATASIKIWKCPDVSPVASTFVSWVGLNINPRDIVTKSIGSWNKEIGIAVDPKNYNNFE